MSEWQPIETAPKDGTCILAWCIHAHASAVGEEVDGYRGHVLARWIEHNGGGWCWHGLAGTFSHWMPLPDAPSPADGK